MGLLEVVLIVVLLLLLLGAVPAYNGRATYGGGPIGIVGLLVIVIIIVLLFRVI